MTNTLLVPIYLDALYLPDETSVIEEMTDYSKLPYFNKKRERENPDFAYLSETVLSPPFEQANLTLKAGIHLHWAMPDALSNGIAREGEEGITFPLVPNRWLIMRRGGNQPEKQWVVESDYLYPEGEKPQDAINILYHPDSDEYQPYRFLGRKLELKQWLSTPANAQYIEELTAIGPFATVDSLDNEKAAFAGFYPNCRSVFGFHDADFKTTKTPPRDLQYDVIGWYSDVKKDYVDKFIKECGTNDPQSLLEILQEKAGWTLEIGKDQGFPSSLLCHGSLRFKPGNSLTNPQDQNFRGKIAVGNTQEEAIAVYLAHQIDSKIENRHIVEQQLQALQMSEILADKSLDFGPKFLEALHENGFTGQSKEVLWQVVPHSNSNSGNANPANAVQGEGQMQVTLPSSIGERINKVNDSQRVHNQKLARVSSIREQVYADWYKYMQAFYAKNKMQYLEVPEDLDSIVGEEQHSKLIKDLIELSPVPLSGGSRNEYGIPALEEESEATGFLELYKDEEGDIVNAEASVSQVRSSAAILAEEINQLIADVKEFNRKSRLIAPSDSPITVTGNSELVEDDFSLKCLEFDGTQYYKVSGLKNIQSLSMWVRIPEGGRGALLDARNDLPNSLVNSSNGTIGSNWAKMYIDGQEVKAPLTWGKIPKNTWVFLHLEAKTLFSGTIHLMSNSAGAECLKGRIASVSFHTTPLSAAEIQQSYRDKIGFLRPSYTLKIVPGPRFWQPSNPVVLMTGAELQPTRNREDERLNEDGLLRCELLTRTMNLAQLPQDNLTLLKTIVDNFVNEPKEKIGFREWKDQPWNPFLLEWQVNFCTLRHNTDANQAKNIQDSEEAFPGKKPVSRGTRQLIEKAVVKNYDPKMLQDNYQLRVNGVELSLQDPSKVIYEQDSSTYTGASFLSPSAAILLKDNLIDYLKKYLLPNYYEEKKTPTEDQTEDFLTKNFNAVKSWYKPKQPLVNDSINTALRALEQLESLECLAQSLGGFNDSLLTYSRTMQLGVEDSLVSQSEDSSRGFQRIEMVEDEDFEDPDASGDYNHPVFLRKMQKAIQASGKVVPDSILRSLNLHNIFTPLRAGVMRISQLRLVDTFGRIKRVVESGKNPEIITCQSLTIPSNLTPPQSWRDPIYLPPRLAQPARLNFRLLSATQSKENQKNSRSLAEGEMNDSPATSPICGWILPNNLDNSLTVYDNRGNALVIINSQAILESIPGRDLTEKEIKETIEKTNPYLRKMVEYLRDRGKAFFTDFLTAVNKSLETIDPEGFAQNQAISLLVARPLALVRAKVNLELQGIPAISQNITDFSADVIVNPNRSTADFQKLKFSVRIGEYQQFNDSLVGYWVETAEGTYERSTFYAPQSCYVPEEKIKTLFEGPKDPTPDTPINLEQSLEGETAQTLVMLMDPRGQINATCGVLPAKRISITPEHYLPALQSIAVTFLSAPLLSDLNPIENENKIKLSLPGVPGYLWSWVGKEGTTWSNRPLHPVDSQSISSSPQKIYDGWLKLTRKDKNS